MDDSLREDCQSYDLPTNYNPIMFPDNDDPSPSRLVEPSEHPDARPIPSFSPNLGGKPNSKGSLYHKALLDSSVNLKNVDMMSNENILYVVSDNIHFEDF